MAGKSKIYQITVQGTRSVESVVTEEYNVTAENQDDAVITAKNEYNKRYSCVDADVTEVSLKSTWNKWNIAAIFCLLIPFLFSFLHWNGRTKDPPLQPDGITMIMAIAIYSAFIIRVKVRFEGLKESFNSFSKIIIMILTLWFCASFLNVFINEKTIPVTFFGLKITELHISGKWLLLIAALLSWLSVPALAGAVWALLFLFAIDNMVSIFGTMKNAGTVYVLSAFFGIIFQIGQESSYFLKSLRGDIINAGAMSAKRIKRDITASSNAAMSIAKTVVSAASTAATGVPVNLPTNKTNTSTDGTNTRQ